MHGVSPQVFLGWLFQHLARAHVETAAVQRTLHQLTSQRAGRQRCIFVSAYIISGVETAIDVGQENAPAFDIDPLHLSGLKLAESSYLDKIARHNFSLLH
jgi:hypothetical protein